MFLVVRKGRRGVICRARSLTELEQAVNERGLAGDWPKIWPHHESYPDGQLCIVNTVTTPWLLGSYEEEAGGDEERPEDSDEGEKPGAGA